MIIIEDTRQQAGKHDLKHGFFGQNGVRIVRSKLPFGDYCLPPRIAIDTKQNISEIAGNICGTTKEHVRFREECKLAKECGCKLIILIENEEGIRRIEDLPFWENPRAAYSSTACTGERLAKTMLTMSERYGVQFIFCDPANSAKKIMELLNGDERIRN